MQPQDQTDWSKEKIGEHHDNTKLPHLTEQLAITATLCESHGRRPALGKFKCWEEDEGGTGEKKQEALAHPKNIQNTVEVMGDKKKCMCFVACKILVYNTSTVHIVE